MESHPQFLEEKIEHIRYLLSEKMKGIYAEHDSIDPAEQEQVINAILMGQKIGLNTWTGDALVNLPELRFFPVKERELIIDSILNRE